MIFSQALLALPEKKNEVSGLMIMGLFGVSKNGQIVLDVVQEKYEQDVMFALKGKQFRLAELGNDAGMYGAVRMVLS